MSKVNIVTISVIIPVKNEAKKIRSCIDGILNQTISVLEIIVIDSGSTDGTLDILEEYDKVRVIEIPSDDFNHGATRNLGVKAAKGDYCLLTVGDAKSCDTLWIERLLDGFVDEEVSAVCGQQVVPHETDKNPVEWFRPLSEPSIITYKYKRDEFELLSPEGKRKVCAWDDVTALYKRDVLLSLPFRFTTYAEDAQWAKDAIEVGYKISYNYRARVFHYHKADSGFAFRQSFTMYFHMYKFFGVTPVEKKMSFRKKIMMLKILCSSTNISLFEKIEWWKYNILLNNQSNLAVKEFLSLLSKGDDYLEKFHDEKFSLPPVPLKS